MDRSTSTALAPARWIRPGRVRLPVDQPGQPDTRSPARLLLWVGRQQVPTLVAGIVFGVLWMLSQALMPFTIGRAIEDGIVQHDNRALALWTLALVGLGPGQARTALDRRGRRDDLERRHARRRRVRHHRAALRSNRRVRRRRGDSALRGIDPRPRRTRRRARARVRALVRRQAAPGASARAT